MKVYSGGEGCYFNTEVIQDWFKNLMAFSIKDTLCVLWLFIAINIYITFVEITQVYCPNQIDL